MIVLDEMLRIREELKKEDREEALEALTRYIHSEVAQGCTEGFGAEIFRDEEELENFLEFNDLSPIALQKLFYEMWLDNLLEDDNGVFPVELTPLGVEKLCL